MYRIPIYKFQLVREKSLLTDTKKINFPTDTYPILSSILADLDREHFVALMLSARHDVIGVNTISVGTLTASAIHPREVFKPALLLNSAAIILAHNHPSGDPMPSIEDIECTKELVEAGKKLGIEILDHIIVGFDRFCSMKGNGHF